VYKMRRNQQPPVKIGARLVSTGPWCYVTCTASFQNRSSCGDDGCLTPATARHRTHTTSIFRPTVMVIIWCDRACYMYGWVSVAPLTARKRVVVLSFSSTERHFSEHSANLFSLLPIKLPPTLPVPFHSDPSENTVPRIKGEHPTPGIDSRPTFTQHKTINKPVPLASPTASIL